MERRLFQEPRANSTYQVAHHDAEEVRMQSLEDQARVSSTYGTYDLNG